MQLVINTYGTYLHIKDELFEVRIKKDGIVQKHHFASQKVKSILLSKGAAISTDAIILAVKNNIDILVFEYDGTPIGRFWHSRPGSTSKIRKKQLEASLNEIGVKWVKDWLAAKIDNQAEFLLRLKKNRANKSLMLDEKIESIENLKKKIISLHALEISEIDDTLRGLEGTAGRIYFQTLNELLSERYKFSGRSFRPAKDPFNAFLNYAYGILYSRVEKTLTIAGLDPFVGFMHRDDYNTKSLVFDFIEPYRIIADEVVFKLFSAKKVNDKHSDKITNGYSLNAEGKNLLVQHFFKFFDEDKIRHKNRNQTRSNAMQLDAHHFANQLIKKQ
ncbi:MAG: CRISPR-associated endonuclease Cas1 [Chlorobi bacterium]|nr:CRISPR-associated endonuclease Cas1 [Chlorobiota bacterium]